MSPAAAHFADLIIGDQLMTARRGTAYFAQHLAELTDDELEESTALTGWTRRHLLAHVGYNAAALCRLLDWAATGKPTPMYHSVNQRTKEIADGATLNAAALRNLFIHNAARLDEKWRHLPDSAWEAPVRTIQGRLVPARETAWMRSREVWIHAVDLSSQAAFGDFPSPVLESLLGDIVSLWRGKGRGAGLTLVVDDREPIVLDADAPEGTVVAGSLPTVVRWAAGRGSVGLISGADAQPPQWL